MFINYALVYVMILTSSFSTLNVRILFILELTFFVAILIKNRTSDLNLTSWVKNIKNNSLKQIFTYRKNYLLQLNTSSL